MLRTGAGVGEGNFRGALCSGSMVFINGGSSIVILFFMKGLRYFGILELGGSVELVGLLWRRLKAEETAILLEGFLDGIFGFKFVHLANLFDEFVSLIFPFVNFLHFSTSFIVFPHRFVYHVLQLVKFLYYCLLICFLFHFSILHFLYLVHYVIQKHCPRELTF